MINKTLFTKELKRNRRHFVIWAVVVAFFTVFIMSFFPNLSDMGPAMEEMMKGFPPAMRNAFGMDPAAFGSFMPYYSIYYGIHIMVLSGIFTITLAADILSKEEREGTADFLLTRPLWRHEVVASKMAAFGVYFVLFFVWQIGLSVLGTSIFVDESFSRQQFVIIHVYGVLLNTCFAGLGFIISLLPKRSRSITGLVIAIVVGGFIVNALSRISPDTEWLGWISPFKWADFEVMQAGYGLTFWRVLLLLGVGIGGLVATFWVFRRRDVYA